MVGTELNVQHFLRKNPSKGLDLLHEQLGINVVYGRDFSKGSFDPVDDLVILNYNQLESPKENPIVIECRGLILELGSWDIISRSFDRFFNIGEAQNITSNFNWDNFSCLDKEDGSLMVMWFYKGTWYTTTRGSFATQECYGTGRTWNDLFSQCLHKHESSFSYESPGWWKYNLNFIYVFEFCSPYNKMIRRYLVPQLFLLTIFRKDNDTVVELSEHQLDYEAEKSGFATTNKRQFKSLHEIKNFLQKKEEEDATFEGVVIRDNNNLRLKIKSRTYLSLHQICDNGQIVSRKRIIPWILAKNEDELLSYFPEAKTLVNEVKIILDRVYTEMVNMYNKTQGIDVQKEFYLTLQDQEGNKFSKGIMCKLRSRFGKTYDKKEIQKELLNSDRKIYKQLFKHKDKK